MLGLRPPGLDFESCVWRTVSQSSHHPQEVLLAQFSLYVHKGGLKPDSFHFIFSGHKGTGHSIPRLGAAYYSGSTLNYHCKNLGVIFLSFNYTAPILQRPKCIFTIHKLLMYVTVTHVLSAATTIFRMLGSIIFIHLFYHAPIILITV